MFFVVLSAVLGLMHVYLWKRLVKDTTRSARARSVLTVVLLALMTLLVATLVLPRVMGSTELAWLAWPGYLWFGLVSYLFLTLLVLEPVRFALYRRARGRPRPAAEAPPTDLPPRRSRRNPRH
jgi:hypothetical protein